MGLTPRRRRGESGCWSDSPHLRFGNSERVRRELARPKRKGQMKNVSTTVVSVEEIKANPSRFIFCTIPRWAKRAEVDDRGNVLRWMKKSTVIQS